MEKSETIAEEIDPKRLQKIAELVGLADGKISPIESGQERFGTVKNVVCVEKETGLIHSKGNDQFAIKIPKQIALISEMDASKNRILFTVSIKRDAEGKIIKKLTAEMI